MATFPILPCCRRSHVKGIETLVIETSSGQQIILETSPATILIQDGNGNSVRMDPSGISILSATKLTISVSEFEISAAQVNVNATVAKFSGMVQADTIQANTVIAATVVPGSGNTW